MNTCIDRLLEKTGPAALTELTSPAFEVEYEITLKQLAATCNKQLHTQSPAITANLLQLKLNEIQTQFEHLTDGFTHIRDNTEQEIQFQDLRNEIGTIQLQIRRLSNELAFTIAEARRQQEKITLKFESKQSILLKQELSAANIEIDNLKQLINQLNTKLTAFRNSTFWRITKPLRRIVLFYRQCPNTRLTRKIGRILISPRYLFQWKKINRTKANIKLALLRTKHYIGQKPRLKRSILVLLCLLPGLKSRIMRMKTDHMLLQKDRCNTPIGSSELTPHARDLYQELKTIMEQRANRNT